MDREDVLARIYERGDQLSGRRKGFVSGAAALAIATVVALGTTVLGGASPTELATGGGTTTVVEQRSGSTPRGGADDDPIVVKKRGSRGVARSSGAADAGGADALGRGGGTGPTDPTTESTSTTAPADPEAADPVGPTSTSVACRNSNDPACGDFRYDPPLPANRRAKITITASPASPRVGDVVTFTVRVDDPDGSGLGCESFDADASGLEPASKDGADPHPKQTRCTSDSLVAADRYGPWDPPASAAPREVTFTATYTVPGERTAVYETDDAGLCEADTPCPKRSKELVLTVRPVGD